MGLAREERDSMIDNISVRPIGMCPLGFEAMDICPEGTARISITLMFSFQPYRLSVHPLSADHFILKNIKVNERHHFPGLHPIPLSSFGGNGSPFHLEKLSAGQILSLVVKNITADRHDFRATIFGHRKG